MAESGPGAIINIASVAARNLAAGEAVYAAAKAGLIAFTHAAFAELGDSGIKVSVIVPGLVDTTLIPNNKRLDRELMLAPEDVAERSSTSSRLRRACARSSWCCIRNAVRNASK